MRDEILFDTAGLTGVDLDRYTSFKLRLFAPVGKKLVVNHAGTYDSSLNVFWQVDGMGDSSSNFVAASPDFEQLSGNLLLGICFWGEELGGLR